VKSPFVKGPRDKGAPTSSDTLHEPAVVKGVTMQDGPMNAKFKGVKSRPFGRTAPTTPFKQSRKSPGGPQ
jgi:hypothetical protein